MSIPHLFRNTGTYAFERLRGEHLPADFGDESPVPLHFRRVCDKLVGSSQGTPRRRSAFWRFLFSVLVSWRTLRIPVLLHEANCVPGKTTLVLNICCSYLFARWCSTQGVEPRRIRYYGYYVRSEIKHILKADAWRKLRIEVPRKLLVVIGGSQGAKA